MDLPDVRFWITVAVGTTIADRPPALIRTSSHPANGVGARPRNEIPRSSMSFPSRQPPAIGGKRQRSFPQVDIWPADKLARFAGGKPYFC